MFWLIENDFQLKKLDTLLHQHSYDKTCKGIFVEVIPYRNDIHPCENGICAIYLRPFNSKKGYMLSNDHTEVISVGIDTINNIVNKLDTIYVRDKKEFLHYFTHKNVFDITLHSSPPYIQEWTLTHRKYHEWKKDNKEVNRIIPIVKHYEYCENLFNDLKNNININDDGTPKINKFFNNKASLVFNAVEQSGIRIDRREFEQNFYLPDSDFVHTQYNFKTLTRRPSNKFKGVNYAALNTKNGERKSFIASNDLLVEFDITAYHPSLLAKLIHYEFDSNDIHGSFAKMYNTDYRTAKQLTFKQLYGGIFEEYKDLEFFREVQKFIDKLWGNFKTFGKVEVPISKWELSVEEGLKDMNPQKLLNYYLQGLETAMNVCILWDIIKILRGKNTKLVLYTYDSFLLDYDKMEKEVINEIKNVFKKYKLHTKISYGDTYEF